MTLTVSEIVRALPSFTDEERNRIRNAINACGVVASRDTTTLPSNAEWQLLHAICETLSSEGIEHLAPAQLTRNPAIKNFRAAVPGLMKYFNDASLSFSERMTVLHIGVRLLYENMRSLGVPTTGVTLMRHIHRIPACLDLAYPTYAANGILKLIVEAERVRQESNSKEAGARRRSALAGSRR